MHSFYFFVGTATQMGAVTGVATCRKAFTEGIGDGFTIAKQAKKRREAVRLQVEA